MAHNTPEANEAFQQTWDETNDRWRAAVAQDLMDARGRLTDFVIQRAADTAKRVGFGYAACPIAPATYANLREEFRRASHLGEPFPVYSGASSKTIYTSTIGNWAFRFWHDVLHCEMNADFSPAGERKVASQQCRDCAEAFGSDSMEFKLLAADTIGQVQYYTECGGFVEDQLTYVLDLIESGWVPE